MLIYSYIIYPIEIFYKFIYLLLADWLGNYGIAVIALSLFSFILLYPFTRKAYQIQQEELHLQSVLQMQQKEIEAKYSGAEQFKKIQRLYDRYSYHPIMSVRSVFGLLIQLPFLLAVFYMLSNCKEIQGVSWGFIPNLGQPDHLMGGINVLPFVMTLATVIYAFIMPEISKKERLQTIGIGLFFLFLLYSSPSALLIFWTCNLTLSLLDSVLCKKLKWLVFFISDNEMAFQIIFALALTIGLLVPSDIYITNAKQLWFNYKDILKYFLADSVKYFCVLFLVYVICWGKKIKSAYLCILFGLLLGIVLQSYVIGLDYGTFDGHEIEWGQYTIAGIINTLVWITCLAGVLIISKCSKPGKQQVKTIIKRGTFAIVLVQCLALLISLLKNPIQKDIIYEDGKAGVLTTKNLITVSANKNIIVFLLDAFDASLFEEVLSKNPEIMTALKGFTYYPDTISSYGYTHYSLPEILTGRQYDNRFRFYDFLKNAWNNNPYYNALIKNNFLINIYTDDSYVATNSPVNNLVTAQIAMNDDIVGQLREIVKFRIAPHYLKYLYYQYSIKGWDAPLIDKTVEQYRQNDRQFYLKLKKGLKINEKVNCFQFYHLDGIHHPFILNENVEYINSGEKGTAYKQALGSLKIVNEYIQQMKDMGIFNDTVFAIIADHGTHNSIGSRPLFLIRKKGEKADFSISSRPTEIFELMPLLLKSQGVYSGVLERNSERFFYHEDKNRNFIRYMVKSPAKDINSWISLGKVIKKAHNGYFLGDIIDFSYFGNSFNYKKSGWYSREFAHGSVIAEHEAEIMLELKNISDNTNDLIIRCLFGAILPELAYQNVKLYANDELIGVLKFENRFSDVEYVIPRRSVFNNIITLKFVVDKPGEEPVYDGSNPLLLQEIQIFESKGK